MRRQMAWPNPLALATAACLLPAGLPWLTAQEHDPRGAALQPASVSATSRQGYVPIEQLRVVGEARDEQTLRFPGFCTWCRGPIAQEGVKQGQKI